MKKVTTTDLRTIRTKNAIHSAFQEMAANTSIDHITVKELAQLAGINRKTFYSHYDSIEALEQELLREVIQDIHLIIQNDQPHNFQDTLGGIYRFLCNLPFWYRNVMCSKDNPVNHQIFIEFMGSHLSRFQSPYTPGQMEQYMKLRYIAAASIELFRVWHESNGAIPVDDFVALATGLVCYGEQHI